MVGFGSKILAHTQYCSNIIAVYGYVVVMSFVYILQWLNDLSLSANGLVSSWLLVDLLLFFLVTLTTLKLVIPVIRGYWLGNKLCALCGTDGNRHWFYGHTRKVSKCNILLSFDKVRLMKKKCKSCSTDV